MAHKILHNKIFKPHHILLKKKQMKQNLEQHKKKCFSYPI